MKNNKSYQQKTNEEIITSLKSDIRYYNHTKNNKLKSLKRLYSLFKLTNNKNTEIIKKFLNLKMIGSKYKLKSDLEIILLMIEQKFKKVKINKIIEILKKNELS
jgi:flagellar assembly factor FliW